eukprot:9464797-Lingulodinium_polyedra.AAC.1
MEAAKPPSTTAPPATTASRTVESSSPSEAVTYSAYRALTAGKTPSEATPCTQALSRGPAARVASHNDAPRAAVNPPT